MFAEDHGCPIICTLRYQLPKGTSSAGIETRKRLVEHQHVGLPKERLNCHDLLQRPLRQHTQPFGEQRASVKAFDQLQNLAATVTLVKASQAHVMVR